jgi:hypothetical protein
MITEMTLIHSRVKQMAKKIGDELWAAGEAITRREEVQQVVKKCLAS